MSNGEEEINYEADSIEQMIVDGAGVLLIKSLSNHLGIINTFTNLSVGADMQYRMDHVAVEALADKIRHSGDSLFRNHYLLTYCRPQNES